MAAMAELTDAYFCYNSIKASSKYGKAAIFPRLFIIFSIIIHLNTITIFPIFPSQNDGSSWIYYHRSQSLFTPSKPLCPYHRSSFWSSPGTSPSSAWPASPSLTTLFPLWNIWIRRNCELWCWFLRFWASFWSFQCWSWKNRTPESAPPPPWWTGEWRYGSSTDVRFQYAGACKDF